MATLLNSTGVLRPRGRPSLIDPDSTRELAPLIFEPDRLLAHQAGTMLLGFSPEPPRAKPTMASYVQGVSLANVLQMLHLERMTCMLEVTADGHFGTLTLVNGELVDADVNGQDGEDAVYAILAWPRPYTTILDGVTLFRNTVKSSLATLIVEAVRRQDESAPDAPTPVTPRTATPDHAQLKHSPGNGEADWRWLVETLVISGAAAAAVVRPADEHVLAQASEHRVGQEMAIRELTGELALVARVAVDLARHRDTQIDEVTLRFGPLHALVVPLAGERGVYVCATFSQTDAIAFARSTVLSLAH